MWMDGVIDMGYRKTSGLKPRFLPRLVSEKVWLLPSDFRHIIMFCNLFIFEKLFRLCEVNVVLRALRSKINDDEFSGDMSLYA